MKRDSYSKKVGNLFKTAILSYTCFVGIILVTIEIFSINVSILESRGWLVFLIVVGFFSIAMEFFLVSKSKTRDITDMQSNKEIVYGSLLFAISLPIVCIITDKVMKSLFLKETILHWLSGSK